MTEDAAKSPGIKIGQNPTVFDRVAHDYVSIHNRSLPPGVCSEEFVRQKAPIVAQWIGEAYQDREFWYLDFGCGTGRLFKLLVESKALRVLVKRGKLRLVGFDTSVESLNEARRITADERILFVSSWAELPSEVRFDLGVCFNVFHHIVPAERIATAQALRSRLKPDARLVVWEHNPFNPFTRAIVKLCPFDADAHLMSLRTLIRLFERNSYRCLRHEYVNVFPPKLQQLKAFSAIEKRLFHLPVGAQYWVMFGRDG